jgi:hypothetical protein
MEILKNKKIIVGGLAVIGGIALVSYLLKPKSPKQNSEGFFNAGGISLPNLPTNPFGTPSSPKPINTPSSFTRKDGFCKVCVLYQKTITPKGTIFSKRLTSGNTVSPEAFSITEEEFTLAFIKNEPCDVIK